MVPQRSTIRTRAALFLAALLLTAALPTYAQDPIAKKAVPDATAQGKAETLITKLFATQFQAAKNDKAATLALAAELFAQGKATTDDDALQFMALKLASELAAAANDNAAALEVVETLAKSFKVDTLGLKSALYAQAEKSLTSKEDARELTETVLYLIEEALHSDNFAVAAKLMTTAAKAVEKSEKLALVARVEKRGKEVEDARKAFATIQPLLAKVAGGNDQAILAVGNYYCFVKGDYDKGLPLLAKSTNAALKALAQRDLAKPQEPKKQVELADDWYAFAEAENGLAQRQTFRRAALWYQAALPRLEGLTRVRIDRRVVELARLFPTVSVPMALVEITTELRSIERVHADVQGVAISSDGKRILTSGNPDHAIRYWDATTGRKIKDLLGHGNNGLSVAISADNKWGLSGGHDNHILLWNLETGQEVRRINNTVLPYVVRFLPGGKQLISGNSDGTLRLYDVDSGKLVRTLTGHTALVYGLSVSKDGKRALSAGYDSTARVWDLEKNIEIQRFTHTKAVHNVALSPDGKRAVTTGLDHVVKVWDVDTGKALHTLTHPGLVWSVAISTDGRRVYTGCGGGLWTDNGSTIPATRENSEIRVWDLNSGKELRQLKGHHHYVYRLEISADGRFLVSGSQDGSVRLWGAK